jgi:hypothetical protein
VSGATLGLRASQLDRRIGYHAINNRPVDGLFTLLIPASAKGHVQGLGFPAASMLNE